MSLTQNQLNSLRADLQGLANIEYDEVMAELLDHYATLTEQKMANGLPFIEATNRAWAELGSGIGLEQIQTDYEKNVRQQVKIRHIEILKSYFGWPAFIITVLAAALIYIVVPLLPAQYVIGSIYLLSMVPALVLWWGRAKHIDKFTDSRGIIWKYVQKSGSFICSFVPAVCMLTSGLFSDGPIRTFFQIHTSVSAVLCLLALLYSISFIQLFREKFTYKPKFA